MSSLNGSKGGSRTGSASAGPRSNASSTASGASFHSRQAASLRSSAGRPTTTERSCRASTFSGRSRRANPCSTVPHVRPGGESLLHLSGWPKVEKVLHAIDGIEALGIDPADAAPDHWRHIHNRLSVGEQPRPYSRSRHQAWLHRRKLTR